MSSNINMLIPVAEYLKYYSGRKKKSLKQINLRLNGNLKQLLA